MKNALLILICTILLISCKTAQQNKSQSDLLTKNLELAYQKDAIKGFSVSIVNDKGLIYDKGFGFAILVNSDTDFTDDVWLEIEEIWKSLSDYEKIISK